MIKSRRKLRPMKVVGARVYDPMPRNPESAPRVRSTHNVRAFDARSVNVIAVNASNRNVRVLKSGKRKISF